VNFNNNLAQKSQKQEKESFEFYIKLANKGTKAKFLFHKNFCVSFVVFSFD